MKQCNLKEQERLEILLSVNQSGDGLSRAASAHLLECKSCSEAFVEQAALWTRLDAWTVPEVSSSFNRELYAKIDAALAEPWYDRWARQIKSSFAQPSLALGLAALVVVAGFTLDHSTLVRQRQPNTSRQVSNAEAEQVEKTLDDLEMLRQFDLASEEKESTSKSM